MVEYLVARAVVACSQVRFPDRHAHCIRDALAERSRRRLHSPGEVALGVAGREALPLTEALELLDGHLLVAHEVHQGIEQRRGVAGRQYEAIAINEARVGWA